MKSNSIWKVPRTVSCISWNKMTILCTSSIEYNYNNHKLRHYNNTAKKKLFLFFHHCKQDSFHIHQKTLSMPYTSIKKAHQKHVHTHNNKCVLNRIVFAYLINYIVFAVLMLQHLVFATALLFLTVIFYWWLWAALLIHWWQSN